MTTHANCDHPNTKSERAKCRRAGTTPGAVAPRAKGQRVDLDAEMLEEMRNYRTPKVIRTDIHRPQVFDPEAYEYSHSGTYAGDEMYADIRKDAARMLNLRMSEGYIFAPHQASGQCGHCGSRLTHYAVMLHLATKQMILVGETCLEGRFEMATHAFRQWRKMRAGKNARDAKAERMATLLEKHPFLSELPPAVYGDDSFLASLSRQLHDRGELSDRQIDAARAALAREATRTAKREAEAEAMKNLPPLQPGKRTITGEVIHTKWVDSRFSYGSLGSLKGLIRDADGYKFWGTLPTAWNGKKGDTITITATIEPKEGEPAFAFYKRPRLS